MSGRFSYVWGGVSFDQIFTQHLEKSFTSLYPLKVEVLNCGVSSYSLKEYPIYLKNKGIRFNPNIVIVGLCLNDYILRFRDRTSGTKTDKLNNPNKMNRQDNPKLKDNKEFARKIKRFLFHSYFLEYIQTFISLKTGKHNILSEYSDMMKEESWRRNSIYIRELKEICKDNNAYLLFVIFPVAQQFGHLRENEMPQAYIEKLLSSFGVPVVNLRNDFRMHIENGEILYSSRDSVHFMSLGHKIAADATAKKILKQGFFFKKYIGIIEE